MLTVYDLLGTGSPQSSDIGIEVEVEFASRPPPVDIIPGIWRSKTDGSLRFVGREYATRSPISQSLVLEIVLELCGILNDERFDTIKDSPRAGVHVHINMSGNNVLDVYKVATAYWLMEDLMIQYCGAYQRKGNNYCMGLSNGEARLSDIIEDLQQEFPFRSPAFGSTRYCGMNLAAITKFGSIEFRSMRATTDPNVISDWASSLYWLKQAASEFQNPEQLYDWYIDASGQEILNRFFPSMEEFKEKLMAFPSWEDDLKENILLIDRLAYIHDWDMWIQQTEEKIRGPLLVDVPCTEIEETCNCLECRASRAEYDEDESDFDD